jgi:hypothetical protein
LKDEINISEFISYVRANALHLFTKTNYLMQFREIIMFILIIILHAGKMLIF